MTDPLNRAQRALALLERRYPGWVPAMDFEQPCGRQAWRTAISEARTLAKADGGDIENRTRRMRLTTTRDTSVQTWTLSEYRLKRASESRPVVVDTPHDLNALAPSVETGRLW